MNRRHACRIFALSVALLAVMAAGRPGMAWEPQVLPTVGDTFAAPYEAVWDATLRSLGVVGLRVADKATGRIETEPFPFAFTVGQAPARSAEPVRLAALETAGVELAQSGGGGARPTQVIWVAMTIAVTRVAEAQTTVQVAPRIHDSLLMGFTPGPTNNPWADLFARIRSHLGSR